tara:strand:- start:1974 stop:3014 length:1041 start_codon:yes stop_codon:yes gene_type:complete
MIFLIVLFAYLHIHFQLKTSNTTKVFEVDHTYKKFDDVFDLKQPVVMKSLFTRNFFDTFNDENFVNYISSKDVNVKNIQERRGSYIKSSLSAAQTLFDSDTSQSYYSDKNKDLFVDILPVYRRGIERDLERFKPPLTSSVEYDIITGSPGVSTNFEYSIRFRNYFIIVEGSATVRMLPPDKVSEVTIKKDYENLSFSSSEDMWDDPGNKYVEVNVSHTQGISIPPYWLYSIKLDPSQRTRIFHASFNTYVTDIATINHNCMFLFNKMNRKRVVPNTHTPEKETEDQSKSLPETQEESEHSEEEPIGGTQDPDTSPEKENSDAKTSTQNIDNNKKNSKLEKDKSVSI